MNEWTTTLPTKRGYYWWRKNKYKTESIYFVFQYTHLGNTDQTWYCRWSNEGLYDRQTLEEVAGEWYGPLSPP